MDTVAAPALAQYRSVTLRIRANAISGPYIVDAVTVDVGGVKGTYDQIAWTTTITTFTGAGRTTAPNGAAWTQALIDDMKVVVKKAINLITQNVYELYADVVYNEAPVSTVTAPTGTVTTTSQPAVTWTYTDPEGDAQERVRIKIFSAAQYGAVGFNPETATATWDSGEIFSGGTTYSPIPVALPNNTTYRAYVKTADVGSGGRYSNWAFNGFSILIDSPAAPDLTVTADNTLARVLLSVQGRDNLLTLNQSTIETGTVGLVAGTNAGTLTRDTAQFRQGISSLRFQSVAAGDMKVSSLTGLNGVPVTAGQTFTGLASIRPASARSVRAEIAFYDVAGAQIGSNTNGTSAAPGAATWSERTVTVAAPTGAVTAAVFATVLATGGAAEQAWTDQLGIFPGTTAAWTRGGFVYDLGRLADTYDRADSAVSLGNSEGPGTPAWAAQAGTWGISSLKAYLASATATASAVLTSTGLVDGIVQSDITLSPTPNRALTGLIFRDVDNNNYLVYQLTKTATVDGIALYKRSGGTFTLLASQGGLGFVNGSTYIARAEFYGGTIRMYVNGVLRLTHILSAPDLATYGNNLKYGIFKDVGAAVDDGGSRFDNFTVGNPKAQSAVVERSIDGGTNWVAVRGLSSASAAATSATQALSAYDYELPRSITALYRAQIQAVSGGLVLAGPNSANQSVTLASTGWWFKDPLAPGLNMQLDVARFDFDQKKPQQVYESLGATASTVVHDGVRGAAGTMEIYTKTAARYAKFQAIFLPGRTLYLENVLGQAWYVQIGEAVRWSLKRAAPDVGETTPIRHYYEATVPFTEVASPTGQTVTAGTPTP